MSDTGPRFVIVCRLCRRLIRRRDSQRIKVKEMQLSPIICVFQGEHLSITLWVVDHLLCYQGLGYYHYPGSFHCHNTDRISISEQCRFGLIYYGIEVNFPVQFRRNRNFYVSYLLTILRQLY